MQEVSQRWASLTPAQKSPYVQKAHEDKLRYESELATFKNRHKASKPTKAPIPLNPPQNPSDKVQTQFTSGFPPIPWIPAQNQPMAPETDAVVLAEPAARPAVQAEFRVERLGQREPRGGRERQVEVKEMSEAEEWLGSPGRVTWLFAKLIICS